MSDNQTKEPQYQDQIIFREENGLTPLGMASSLVWHQDPKRLLFILSRYKFVSKMLNGKKRVLEVGCSDAFGTQIVLQEVGSICAVDFDAVFIKDVNDRLEGILNLECKIHDITKSPVNGVFDAAYALDVLEHIPRDSEDLFMSNICDSIDNHGILIIGIPSVHSQQFASEASKQGHVNCKDNHQLKELILKYFHNVFIFSMNDEVVHTGFSKMAHYFFALGVGRRHL